MKAYTFLYNKFPYNVGNDLNYDIIFAESKEHAIEIRKNLWEERFCSASDCKIEEVEIHPGLFKIVEVTYKERRAIPKIETK